MLMLAAVPDDCMQGEHREKGDLAYVGWEAITHGACLRAAAAKAEPESDRLPRCLLIFPCKALSDLQSISRRLLLCYDSTRLGLPCEHRELPPREAPQYQALTVIKVHTVTIYYMVGTHLSKGLLNPLYGSANF